MLYIFIFLFGNIYDRIWGFFFKRQVLIKEEKIDPIIVFVKQRQDRLMRTYENKIDMNVNIESVFYNKSEFSEMMKMPDNPIEKRWKKCILYESTPRGSIYMYYDAYKGGFAYYADQNCIPYSILNAMSMKYVVTFFCRDFFMDESIITELSKLREVESKIATQKKKENNGQIAKFKNYKTMEEGDKPKVLIRNKFISLGKPYNFEIIQKKMKIPQLNMTGPNKFDNMFKMSYKDFKKTVTAP